MLDDGLAIVGTPWHFLKQWWWWWWCQQCPSPLGSPHPARRRWCCWGWLCWAARWGIAANHLGQTTTPTLPSKMKKIMLNPWILGGYFWTETLQIEFLGVLTFLTLNPWLYWDFAFCTALLDIFPADTNGWFCPPSAPLPSDTPSPWRGALAPAAPKFPIQIRVPNASPLRPLILGVDKKINWKKGQLLVHAIQTSAWSQKVFQQWKCFHIQKQKTNNVQKSFSTTSSATKSRNVQKKNDENWQSKHQLFLFV